jgi:hypothetical protein
MPPLCGEDAELLKGMNMRLLLLAALFVPCAAFAAPPAVPLLCVPQSQAQAIVAYLAAAPALQALIIEASQAAEREAAIVAAAKAAQKAEDDAAAKAKP